MNTTWYLHSHVVWLKLSYLSIVVSSPLVCLAAHEGSLHDGHSLKCQTSTATPAEPGELPGGLDSGKRRSPRSKAKARIVTIDASTPIREPHPQPLKRPPSLMFKYLWGHLPTRRTYY